MSYIPKVNGNGKYQNRMRSMKGAFKTANVYRNDLHTWTTWKKFQSQERRFPLKKAHCIDVFQESLLAFINNVWSHTSLENNLLSLSMNCLSWKEDRNRTDQALGCSCPGQSPGWGSQCLLWAAVAPAWHKAQSQLGRLRSSGSSEENVGSDHSCHNSNHQALVQKLWFWWKSRKQVRWIQVNSFLFFSINSRARGS